MRLPFPSLLTSEPLPPPGLQQADQCSHRPSWPPPRTYSMVPLSHWHFRRSLPRSPRLRCWWAGRQSHPTGYMRRRRGRWDPPRWRFRPSIRKLPSIRINSSSSLISLRKSRSSRTKIYSRAKPIGPAISRLGCPGKLISSGYGPDRAPVHGVLASLYVGHVPERCHGESLPRHQNYRSKSGLAPMNR